MGAPYVVPWSVAVLSNSARNRLARAPRSGVNLFASSGDDGDASSEEKDSVFLSPEEYDAIPAGIRDDIEAGAPSQMTVMKELLGINVFTYVLAAACIFFLSLNFVLGPGWLGQVAGIPGTGTFTEVSDTLPQSINLSNPENLL